MNTDFRFPLKSKYSDYVKKTEEKAGQTGTLFEALPPDAILDVDYFEKLFAEAVSVAEERKVLLYCGEYGVIENATPQDTLEWYRLISTVLDNHGIGRAAWSYKQMNFGLNDNRLEEIRGDLIRHLQLSAFCGSRKAYILAEEGAVKLDGADSLIGFFPGFLEG